MSVSNTVKELKNTAKFEVDYEIALKVLKSCSKLSASSFDCITLTFNEFTDESKKLILKNLDSSEVIDTTRIIVTAIYKELVCKNKLYSLENSDFSIAVIDK